MIYLRRQTFWFSKYLLCSRGSVFPSISGAPSGHKGRSLLSLFWPNICAEIWLMLFWKLLANAELPPLPNENSATSQDPQIPSSAFILPLSAKTEVNHLGSKREWNNYFNWCIMGNFKFSTHRRNLTSINCDLASSSWPVLSVSSRRHAPSASHPHPPYSPGPLFSFPTCSLI